MTTRNSERKDSLRNRPEKLAEGLLFCLFLKFVQINFIFTDNVRILYIYVSLLDSLHPRFLVGFVLLDL